MYKRDAQGPGTGYAKRELYSAAVWILAGLSLTAYCILGLLNTAVPGVEELVVRLSAVEGKYVYAAAFASIFIEGLYLVGSFFPGSSLVVILAILSQLSGTFTFVATISAIFLGWCLAGAVNIFLATLYHAKIARMEGDAQYVVRDRVWSTWFPAFRANYEVAQIADGGNFFEVLISSIRVKFWASIGAALCVYVLSQLIDITTVSNTEGFATAALVAAVSFAVGVAKLSKYRASLKAG